MGFIVCCCIKNPGVIHFDDMRARLGLASFTRMKIKSNVKAGIVIVLRAAGVEPTLNIGSQGGGAGAGK